MLSPTSGARSAAKMMGPLPVRPPGSYGALPSHLRRGPAGIRLPQAATTTGGGRASTSVSDMSSQMKEVGGLRGRLRSAWLQPAMPAHAVHRPGKTPPAGPAGRAPAVSRHCLP
jgi:hypothetical protein